MQEKILACGDIDKFWEKIHRLRRVYNQIASRDEHQETRLISPYLFNKQKWSPLVISVITDNLEYFKTNLTHATKKLLGLACLFGSRSVGRYLLHKLDATPSSPGFDFVLCYVALSGNNKWAEEIAQTMASDAKQMPDHLYALCPNKLLEQINGIFHDAGVYSDFEQRLAEYLKK